MHQSARKYEGQRNYLCKQVCQFSETPSIQLE